MRAHEFLIDEDEPERPLETMAELRDYVDGLPDTAALWSPADATDGWPHRVTDEMLASLGTWRPPEQYHSGSQASVRYVNPQYAHAHTYSDLQETCDCGYRYGYTRTNNDGKGAVDTYDVHDEDCSAESRRRAKVRLYFRRVAWLKKQALLWNRQPIARGRLGCTDHQASRYIKELPESYFDWYGRGKQMAANTMTILRGWGVDAQLIADAYGSSRQTVYTYKDEAERSVVERRAPRAFEDHRRKSVQ